MATTKESFQVSEFYLACQNGDVAFVTEYLINMSATKHDLNPLEPHVKSTPLHVASYYGHKEIVQLLIKYECDRSKINGLGLTAYEEAANDEIRQLFKRPSDGSGARRFQDETTEDCFAFVTWPKDIEEASVPAAAAASSLRKTTSLPVQAYKTKTEHEIGYAITSTAICQSKLGRFVANMFHHEAPMSLETIGMRLQQIIDNELIANNDSKSNKASELLSQFLSKGPNGHIEHLIRLYTLETKLCSALRKNPMPFALPMYITLQTLKDRYFQGRSYRSAQMDDDEIATYEWAVNNRGSILQTHHFSSTSVKRSVAEEFVDVTIQKTGDIKRNRVLFIFDFPEKCDQAINLSRISDTQPCLSEYEDEAEVLIIPWTLFQVERVHKEPTSYTIYLSNILLPRKSLLSSLKWTLKHPKGCMEHYYEYFPKK